MLQPLQDASRSHRLASRPSTSGLSDISRVAPWTTSSKPVPLSPKASSSAPKKKLVPKKSKLGLFGSQRGTLSHSRSQSHAISASKENAPPPASVAASLRQRTLTSAFSSTRSSSIRVCDPDESLVDRSTVDPDVGEIIVVKRKKSRVGLEGIAWEGALGDVSTNVPRDRTESPVPLKDVPKKEDKWWSTIGRNRKESKDLKASLRAKSPEPAPTHTRFHSLDSGTALKTATDEEPKRAMRGRVSSAKLLNIIPATRTPSGTEHEPRVVPLPADDEEEPPAENPTGSIALRAMRSVRSLARITSWNQLKEALDDDKEKAPTVERKKSGTWSKKDTAKKEKKKDKPATLRIRPSTSSFEIGTATPEPESAPAQSLRRKASKILTLGLGFPTAIRSRSGSTASSVLLSPTTNQPPVLPIPIIGRDRSASGASSLRPASTMTTSSGGSRLSSASMAASTMSRLSSSSSGVSVKWDEESLQTVKERRRKERREKAEQDAREGKQPSKRSAGKKSKNKHTALFDLFPSESAAVSTAGLLDGNRLHRPVLTLDQDDGRSVYSYSSTGTETPTKRRSRPVSESSLRVKGGLLEDGEVISILDAATNELALLINHLDLEATPASPEKTPSRSIRTRSVEISPEKRLDEHDSPLRKKGKLRPIKSIRGPLKSTETSLGQQIAPWPVLNSQLSSSGEQAGLTPKTNRTIKVRAKRQPTPSPAPEAPPVFQPLPPASRRQNEVVDDHASIRTERSHHVPSMITFGKRTSASDMDDADLSDDMTFRRPTSRQGLGLPKMARDMKRRMGLNGTMGGSAASDYITEELDPSGPDSDIPDELQLILTRGAELDRDDTILFRSPLGEPPHIPLPSPTPNELDLEEIEPEIPSLILSRANSAQPPEEESFTSSHSDDEDFTKKSFDFTGEIRRLTTTDSDRANFVEQLERAFKTPAKLDLRYGLDFSFSGAPNLCSESVKEEDEEEEEEDHAPESFDIAACTPVVHPPSESFMPSATSSFLKGSSVEDDEEEEEEEEEGEPSFISNMLSTGELKKDFKFGGLPAALPPLGPPPKIVEPADEEDSTDGHSHFSTDDSASSSVLRSILAEAQQEIPKEFLAPPRPRPRPTVMKPVFKADVARRSVYDDTGSNRSSMISFMGMGETFDEVRRGFEFHDYRPGFYPPAPTTSRGWNFTSKRESVMSFASVSSFGRVLNPGKADPFDYGVHAHMNKGLTNIREQPSVETMSVMTHDTFSFAQHGDHFRPRQRVDSDASSFYFKASARDRRRESAMSTNSYTRPPSLYNRNFGNPHFSHKKGDSGSSFGSLAHNYASYNAAGNRDSWAFHRRNGSAESVASDFSAMRLGRPDIGDKMFDQSSPRHLDAIAVSPGESGEEYTDNRFSTFDSLMDDTRAQKLTFRDSLFDTVGYRASMISTTESVFGADPRYNHLRPQTLKYRPISVASINSVHDPLQDGDTMISMLGGGRVRRISVSSAVEGSPCARVGKRKHAHTYSDVDNDIQESPRKARIIERPPAMLTTSSTFKSSEERVFKPIDGIPNRKSLEESCLFGSVEENTWSFHKIPVFSRPAPQARPRSNTTTTTTSSGQDTPPLEASDGSQSDGSQSSIDLKSLESMLSSSTYSTGRARARSRGRGHRRFSHLQMARASVYETIDEESSAYESPIPLKTLSPPSRQSVYIADPETVSFDGSIGDESIWDNEHGVEILRKFYALREEARDIVQESKRTWADTAFSTFALQTFRVPSHPTGMQALLEHSQKNFGPLPSELRPHRVRSRTSSRVTPYTIPTPARSIKRSLSPGARRPLSGSSATFAFLDAQNNLPSTNLDTERAFGEDDADSRSWVAPRQRVASGSKRNMPGWTKKNASKVSLASKSSSIDMKENAPLSSTGSGENTGMSTTLGQGLRINRPRPKGGRSATSARPKALNIFN